MIDVPEDDDGDEWTDDDPGFVVPLLPEDAAAIGLTASLDEFFAGVYAEAIAPDHDWQPNPAVGSGSGGVTCSRCGGWTSLLRTAPKGPCNGPSQRGGDAADNQNGDRS